jgi:hypothetical protein
MLKNVAMLFGRIFVHRYLQHNCFVNLVIMVMLFWQEWGVHKIEGKLEALPQLMY